jgi:hypothetical protein
VTDIYVSIDVETTGPAPGIYSMISLGAAAFTKQGGEVGTWSANLRELPDAIRHPDTMAFWEGQPEAWALATKNPVPPDEAMHSFETWVVRLGGKPIAAAWPAAFDFSFACWYSHRFLGHSPLGFACLDIRSLAMGLTYSRGYYDLRENQIRAIRDEVDRKGLVEHRALDDAIEQGRLLCALLARTKGGVPKDLSAAHRERQPAPPPQPATSAKARLTTTRTPGVLVDLRGRRWLVDDARLPHSNRERDVCDGCGQQLGDVAYLEHRVDGAIRCAACVEVG